MQSKPEMLLADITKRTIDVYRSERRDRIAVTSQHTAGELQSSSKRRAINFYWTRLLFVIAQILPVGRPKQFPIRLMPPGYLQPASNRRVKILLARRLHREAALPDTRTSPRAYELAFFSRKTAKTRANDDPCRSQSDRQLSMAAPAGAIRAQATRLRLPADRGIPGRGRHTVT